MSDDAEHISMCADICDRADAMKLGLVVFPVENVRGLLAIIRRQQMRFVARSPDMNRLLADGALIDATPMADDD